MGAIVMAPEVCTLLDLPRDALQRRLDESYPVSPEAVAGYTYHGISLGLPGWVERLTWKTFIKAFVYDPARGTTRGWNIRLKQNGLDGPIELQTKNDTPISFGHFAVSQNNGLWLDYGAGHPPWHPLARMIDPLVALKPGDANVLLGVSLISLGRRRISTPTFFCLQRHQPVEQIVQPGVWRANMMRSG